MPIKHSTIGASSAERWIACPGSVRLCESAPAQKPSKYAAEGTVAHGVCEKVLKGEIELWEALGMDGVEAEMLDHVQTYVDHVQALVDGKGKLWVEKKINLKSYDKRAFGTSDAIVFNPRVDTLHVIDFKYGAGHAVDVDNNPQLRFYGLGALASLPPKVVGRAENVALHVVQPRAIHSDGPIRSEWLTVDELTAWGNEVLRPAMEATRAPGAPLNSGSWCRWCPALPICPNHGYLPADVATVDFASPAVALPEPRNLTPEQMAKVLEVREMVEAWFDAIHSIAKGELESGRAIPGYRLGLGRKTKVWNDAGGAEKFLTRELGDKAFVKKLLSPAQALKMCPDVECYIIETVGAPSIVREGSKRAMVAPTAINDFSEV